LTACIRCGRRARHFLADPAVPYVQEFCSLTCVERGQVVDPSEAEITAMQAASDTGGQYLDSLGKTDLATLTPDEWMTFIESVCTGFVEAMQVAE